MLVRIKFWIFVLPLVIFFFGNLAPFQLGDLFVPCVEHIKNGNIGNESDVLIADIDRYFERTSHYPKHILTDIFYQNRNNLSYYKGQGVHLSGSFLDWLKKSVRIDKKMECADKLTGF